jgi:lysyl-tRNA synthetase class 1
VLGVSIEGAGKDHATKGGARDVADAIAREVFKIEPPFDIKYEFFLVGGKKMSSSKGEGSSAREIANLLPPKILRLALIGKEPRQAIDFEPDGDTIPVLFDTYDKYGQIFFDGMKDDYARIFSYAHAPEERKRLTKHFLPRFSQIAFITQMPHLNLFEEVERLKGSPLLDEDRTEAELRARYAKIWLDTYAPEEFRYVLQEEVPEAAKHFSKEQKTALSEILRYIVVTERLDGLGLHTKLHEIRKTSGLDAKDFFGATYLSFLGKESGPKAGWFLSVLPREFLLKRINEVIA